MKGQARKVPAWKGQTMKGTRKARKGKDRLVSFRLKEAMQRKARLGKVRPGKAGAGKDQS